MSPSLRTIIFYIVLLIFLLIGLLSCQTTEPTREISNLEETAIGRAEHEFMMTRDVKTNSIPAHRLLKAKEYVDSKLLKKAAIPFMNWDERGPSNIGGRVRALLIDKRDPSGNTVWVGGVSGGLWKTTDGGSTWNHIDDHFSNLAITTIAQDPTNHDILYFGTGESFTIRSADDFTNQHSRIRGMGIWRSTFINGQDIFSHLQSTITDDFQFVNKLIVTNTGTLIAFTGHPNRAGGGIYSSDSNGASFVKETTTNNLFVSDAEISSTGAIYGAIAENGIYERKRLNSSHIWELRFAAPINSGRIEFDIAQSFPNIIYALIEDRTNSTTTNKPYVKRYFIGEGLEEDVLVPQWSDLNHENQRDENGNFNCVLEDDWAGGQGYYNLSVGINPQNHHHLFFGGIDLFKISTEQSIASVSQISSWFGGCELDSVHADQHIVQFFDNDTVWFANDGGVYKSIDGGTTINFQGNGLNITQMYSADINPFHTSQSVIGGTQDNGSFIIRRATDKIAEKFLSGDGGFAHVSQLDSNDFIISSQRHFYRSRYSTLDLPDDNSLFINPTDLSDFDNVLYIANGHGSYIRWNNLEDSLDYDMVDIIGVDEQITAVRVSSNVPNRVYLGLQGGQVIRVDDAHIGTEVQADLIFDEPGIGDWISCIEIAEGTDDGRVLITSSNYGENSESVYWTNLGESENPPWLPIENNLPDMPVRWAMFNPLDYDQAFIATEMGVWSTDNIAGVTTEWNPTNAGLANTRVDMIKYRRSDNRIVAATHGRGIFTSDDLFCIEDDMFMNTSLSGDHIAANSITAVDNVIVDNNSLLSAPTVMLNSNFEVPLGQELVIQNDGCEVYEIEPVVDCPNADLSNGLVAYYPFNGNANDESGNGHHASSVNASLTEGLDGRVNSAYSFNGMGDFITITDDIASLGIIGNRHHTVSLWIKPTGVSATNANNIFISDYDQYGTSNVDGGCCDDNYDINLGYRSSQVFDYAIRRNNTTNHKISTTIAPLNEWYHIVQTKDQDSIYIRINNRHVQSLKIPHRDYAGTGRLTIGSVALDWTTPPHFTGIIDELRLYNRTLCEEEITELYKVALDQLVDEFVFSLRSSQVSSSVIVANGKKYLIKVDGTYTVWKQGDFSTSCGEIEPLVTYPSNDNSRTCCATHDVAFNFALPGFRCPSSDLPSNSVGVKFNWGIGQLDVHSISSQSYNQNHLYEFEIIGQGEQLSLHFSDNNFNDNWGSLKVQIIEQ